MTTNLALTDSIEKLAGVGPAIANHLAKIHVFVIRDLLFHLPHRYQDRTKLTPIANLLPNTDVVIQGQVVSCSVQYGRRRSLVVKLADDSGHIQLRFFHFSKSQQNRFANGRLFRCFGEARRTQRACRKASKTSHLTLPNRRTMSLSKVSYNSGQSELSIPSTQEGNCYHHSVSQNHQNRTRTGHASRREVKRGFS